MKAKEPRMTRLTYPAPRSATFSTPTGWASRSWTEADVIEARVGGAWFARGRHNFADAAVERAAGLKPQAQELKVSEWIKKLPREQLRILREILNEQTRP